MSAGHLYQFAPEMARRVNAIRLPGTLPRGLPREPPQIFYPTRLSGFGADGLESQYGWAVKGADASPIEISTIEKAIKELGVTESVPPPPPPPPPPPTSTVLASEYLSQIIKGSAKWSVCFVAPTRTPPTSWPISVIYTPAEFWYKIRMAIGLIRMVVWEWDITIPRTISIVPPEWDIATWKNLIMAYPETWWSDTPKFDFQFLIPLNVVSPWAQQMPFPQEGV